MTIDMLSYAHVKAWQRQVQDSTINHTCEADHFGNDVVSVLMYE